MDKVTAKALLVVDAIIQSTNDKRTDFNCFISLLDIIYARQTGSSINVNRTINSDYVKAISDLLPEVKTQGSGKNVICHENIAEAVAARFIPEYMLWMIDGKQHLYGAEYPMLRYLLADQFGANNSVITQCLSELHKERVHKDLKHKKKALQMQVEAIDTIAKGRMTAVDLYKDLCELEGITPMQTEGA